MKAQWVCHAVLLSFFACLSTSAESSASCVAHWESLVNRGDIAGYQALLKEWKSYESLCESQDFYFLKKGLVESILGEFDNAERSFKQGREMEGENVDEFEFSFIELKFQRSTRQGDPDMVLLAEAEKELQGFLERHADHVVATGIMTGIKLVQEDYQEVLAYYEQAEEIGGDSYAMRNATIAAFQIENYQDSILIASKALKKSSEYLSDRDFMLSAAISSAQLMEFQMSSELLQQLYEANPAMKTDQQFARVFAGIKAKYQEAKKQAEMQQQAERQ